MATNIRDKLQQLINETEECIEKCKTKFTNIDGSLKLCRKLMAERKFLVSLLNNKKEIKEAHLKSSNLRHLKAIIHQTETLDNVTGLIKIFKDRSQNVLHVDLVCDGGYTWVKAIARNAQSLHLIWAGEGQYGEKNINNQVDEYLKFAEQNPHNFKAPKIVFYFAGGVTRELANYLKTRGVTATGEIVELDETTKFKLMHLDDESDDDEEDSNNENEDDEKKKEKNDDRVNDENEKELTESELNDINKEFLQDYSIENINRVNLDISTLIALVSEITNGGQNYQFKQPFLAKQAEWERAQNLIPILEEFMKGKELIACETAYNDFMDIVNIVGGPNEKQRANELMKRIRIVPDDPTERTIQLKESSKIKPRAKKIFGTGDKLKAITMTSNLGFVRSAAQQDVKFTCFIHQSRALTEKKQPPITTTTKSSNQITNSEANSENIINKPN